MTASNQTENNKRIEDLKWVLVDLIVDLSTTAELFRETINRQNFNPEKFHYHRGLCRLCNSSAVITLSKFDEAISEYHKEIRNFSDETFSRTKSLKQTIEEKKIYKFRSIYTAHLLNKEKGKPKEPLSLKEGYERLVNITGETFDEYKEFYEWLCPQDYEKSNATSVVSVAVELKDHCITLVGSSDRN